MAASVDFVVVSNDVGSVEMLLVADTLVAVGKLESTKLSVFSYKMFGKKALAPRRFVSCESLMAFNFKTLRLLLSMSYFKDLIPFI